MSPEEFAERMEEWREASRRLAERIKEIRLTYGLTPAPMQLRGHRHASDRDELVHAVLLTDGGWRSTSEVLDLVRGDEPRGIAFVQVSNTDIYSSLNRLLVAKRVERFTVTKRTIWWRAA